MAIVGQPNVGKSSLLNAWSRCDRAIVTDLPGTTRDVVESQLVVGGIPVQVLDTAGIRDAADRVEQLGIERSQAAVQRADLVLLTLDATAGWTAADGALYQSISEHSHIVVLNKIDLATPPALPLPPQVPVVHMAAARGQGIEQLEQAILATVQTQQVKAANADLAINQRQMAALVEARHSLGRVQQTQAEQEAA